LSVSISANSPLTGQWEQGCAKEKRIIFVAVDLQRDCHGVLLPPRPSPAEYPINSAAIMLRGAAGSSRPRELASR